MTSASCYWNRPDNLLTGPIPDEMFQGCFTPMGGAECALSSVKFYLLLHKNYLSGTIPSSIGGARGNNDNAIAVSYFVACLF